MFKSNDIPKRLFRFMDSERIINSLRYASLYYAAPEVFDDKSECTYKYVRPTKKMIERKLANPDFLRERTAEEMSDILTHPGKTKWRMKKATRNECALNLKQVLRKRFRIACFTRTPNSPRMWNEYAREHTGCVLEFEFEGTGCLRNVVYSDTLPHYNDAMCYDDGRHFLNILCHKRRKYAWEDEVRYIVSDQVGEVVGGVRNHPQFMELPFSPSELKSVYLGYNTTKEAEAAIREHLNEPRYQHVRLYQAIKPEDGDTATQFTELSRQSAS